MALRVGLDDTDSPRGGCTTFVLTELLDLAREQGLDLIGPPRLVRLNPNVPWKTRGNAALSATFGVGSGRPRVVGEVGGRALRAYPGGRAAPVRRETDFLEAAWARVLVRARRGEPGTDPALVAVRRPLPATLYTAAVREVVEVDAVVRRLETAGAWYRSDGSPRGLVGAAAAVAWPARRSTWEAISYRAPARIGTAREVDPGSVRRAQRREPDLFLCYDARTRRLLVSPHTACPILFGLRGRTAAAVLRARPSIRSEPVDRWALFRTNQGTGDHLVRREPATWGAARSGWFDGVVDATPEPLPGGHVRFQVRPGPGEPSVPCVAFEPTKELPRLARVLVPGDRLRVWGSRTTGPAVQVEGVEVRRWSPVEPRRDPPRCPDCGRRARSLGHLRGYRCPGCRRRWTPDEGTLRPRPAPAPLGRFHPTPSARRHLAPLGPES